MQTSRIVLSSTRTRKRNALRPCCILKDTLVNPSVYSDSARSTSRGSSSCVKSGGRNLAKVGKHTVSKGILVSCASTRACSRDVKSINACAVRPSESERVSRSATYTSLVSHTSVPHVFFNMLLVVGRDSRVTREHDFEHQSLAKSNTRALHHRRIISKLRCAQSCASYSSVFTIQGSDTRPTEDKAAFGTHCFDSRVAFN